MAAVRVRSRDDAVQLDRLIRIVLMESLGTVRVADRSVVMNKLAVVRHSQRLLIRTGKLARRIRRARIAERTRRRVMLLAPAAQPGRLRERLERWRPKRGSVSQPVRLVVARLVTAVATGCR